MKQQHTSLLPAAAFLFVLLVAAPAAYAQTRAPEAHHAPQPTQPSPIPRAPSVRERQLMMEEMSREMGKGTAPRKSEELRMTEIAEDYRDIQQVNNKMMSSAMRAAEPDYKMIAGSVADMRKRAERLRENLALPPPEAREGEKRPAPKSAEDAAGMKAALLALDRSLMSFVRSPVFKNTDVLDAEAAAKASRDLAEVIERCRLAAKDAEKLAKKDKD
ncbi:MAG TPA: hypothetical protein VF297_05790 [Pyrinomonadaceae bacterium]